MQIPKVVFASFVTGSLMFMAAMLVSGSSFGSASTSTGDGSTGTTATPAPLVVNNPGTGTAGGVVVINGNYAGDYPQYAGGSPNGKARIKPANAGATTPVEVKTDSDVRGQSIGIVAGDKVIIGNNNIWNVTGTGGEVSVGSGSTGTITNSGAAGGGGTSITVTVPGGAGFTVLPGMSVPYNGG